MPRDVRRAFLLAGGLGTRLRPITERTPKCLVPIQGKPLLSIWVEICEHLGIESVLINTHYRADQVRQWAATQKSLVKIELVHEETLLGSAGTVAANREFVRGTGDFYVLYADNLTSADLGALSRLQDRHRGVLTLGLFRSPRPEDCGIVTLDDSGRVLSFEEKPARPKSDLANSGMFLARQSLFDFLPTQGFADFGKHVMPRLTGQMWGCLLDGYVRDIGTLESYEQAQKEWPLVSAPVSSRMAS